MKLLFILLIGLVLRFLWGRLVRVRFGMDLLGAFHALLVWLLGSRFMRGRFGMMLGRCWFMVSRRFRLRVMRGWFVISWRRRFRRGCGLVMRMAMRRWRRRSMMARAVINDKNFITGNNATNEGKGHHASDKGGEEFHSNSLCCCHSNLGRLIPENGVARDKPHHELERYKASILTKKSMPIFIRKKEASGKVSCRLLKKKER